MKLLIVDDEAPTVASLRRGLSEEGFAVDVASDARSADELVSVNDYDAIILDVMLPGGDGCELCRRWRAAGLTAPVLFLTARDDVEDRIRGLNLGGDDYLCKPFAFKELLARLRAVLRRPRAVRSPQIRWGDVVMDATRRRVTRSGEVIPLSLREYQLLEYLASHAGEVVTRTALWEHVWQSDVVPDSNVVDVYVRYLRNKLGRDRDIIQTVRGMGYLLREAEPPTP